MITLSASVNISATKALFGDQLPKAMPYVKAAMLTRLASGGRDEVKKQMPVDFDRPTPFTVRGVFYESAKKGSLGARVYVPESQDQAGKAQREYVRPGVAGTPKRRQKRTEFLLSRMGYLPAGWVTTPGSSTEKLGMIDDFGNLKPRFYAQIVNVLQIKKADTKGARGISMRSQMRAKKMGVQFEWFAVVPGKNKLGRGGSWLPPGVYRRGDGKGKDGDTLHQILKFVRAAKYRPLLDFRGTVETYVVKNAQAAWDASARSVFVKFNTQR